MAEEQEHVTIAQKIRQIPLILRVCAGILAFLFILILLVFQLSSAIRTSSERELASLKEAIGVSSARELFNNYAKERVEKGGGPGLPPDALASFDFAVFEEGRSTRTSRLLSKRFLESRRDRVTGPGRRKNSR